MTIIEARDAVARGAALLDQQRPGWAQRIDTGRLDLSDGCNCILGQLEESFQAATDALWPILTLPSEQCVALVGHGFEAPVDACLDYIGNSEANFRLLQDAWIEAIADRLIVPPITAAEVHAAIQAEAHK